MSSATPTGGSRGDARFFGHPLGLMTLFGTELWERFSYYGMRAILLFFITDTLANGGLGIDRSTGVAIASIYGASVYLLSVVGGWLADRVIGSWRATLYGGVVIATGHVLLAVPGGAPVSFAGIISVAIGTGLLKPNVSSMVGELYEREDPRREGGFAIFYMGINLGSFFSPILVGAARSWGGYHAGFLVAAVGMGLALVFFVLGRKALYGSGSGVANPIGPDERPALVRGGLVVLGLVALAVVVAAGVQSLRMGEWSFGADGVVDAISYLAFAAPVAYFIIMLRSDKVTAPERKRVLAYIPLFVAAMLFWMINEQAASSLAAFAEDHTVLSLLGVSIRPEFFQSVNPLIIIVGAPVLAGVWTRLGDRGPSTAHKFGVGLTLAAASFVFLAGATALVDTARVPAWVLVVTYAIQTVGELFLSPVGLAATTLLAPAAFRSQAMALWFLAPAAGQAITAQLVIATEDLSASYVPYFGLIGIVTLGCAGVFFMLAPWVTRHIAAGEAEAETGDVG